MSKNKLHHRSMARRLALALAALTVAVGTAAAQSPKGQKPLQPGASGNQAAANPAGGVTQAPNGAPAQAPPDVTGVWIDHTGRGAIEITPCGRHLCGYVYWVKDPTTRQGRPVLDVKNPDPARRGKPMCGTQILSGLDRLTASPTAHVWGAGSIYNPEEGANFDAEIKLVSANQLNVLGYLGVKFMGESFTWTRAPSDLPRCGPPRL